MVNVMDVYRNLPGLNCGKCGVDSCMSFAMKLLRGEAEAVKCTPLDDKGFSDRKKRLGEILSNLGKAEETGIIIDEKKCAGCGNCVIVCPVSPAHDGSAGSGKGSESGDMVFRVVDGKVRIINLGKCRRFGEDKKCRLCKDSCPFEAIDFI